MRTHLFSRPVFAAASESGTTPAPASVSADSTNAEVKPIADADQLDELGKAMKQRNVLPTLADAIALMEKAANATSNFYGLPVAIVGYDPESGEVDPAVYEGNHAVLAYVGARKVKFGTGKEAVERNSVKAVVIYPVPKLESIIAGGDAATDWLDKIVMKEASHVAFRNFRDANTVADLMNGAAAAPKTVDDYVTASSREGSGLDTDTFDALWGSFRTMLRKKQPALYDLLPSKPEVINALRSKSYAESQDELAPLEEAGVFLRIGAAIIQGAQNNKDKDGAPAPLDASAIESWLAGRDTLEIKKAAPKAKDFSVLDSMDIGF